MDQYNDVALHNMCRKVVEHADACFESFQEKVRITSRVLQMLKQTYEAKSSDSVFTTVDDEEAEDFETIPDDDIPEAFQVEHKKNVREFVNEHNQRQTIAAQEEEILNLTVVNLNFDSQTDEAESLALLSKKIAEDEVALAQQKQCLNELDAMRKRIYAHVCILRSHIRKERSGRLPQNEIDSIRNFSEKCKQDITELLERYGFEAGKLSTGEEDQEDDVGEDDVSEEHQTAEGEYEEEHDGEAEGEDEGEYEEEDEEEHYEEDGEEDDEEDELIDAVDYEENGEEFEGEAEEEYEEEYEEEDDFEDQAEDEGNDQGQAMLAPVQPAALTFDLPIIGGRKRGREVDADEEEPSAKRVFR